MRNLARSYRTYGHFDIDPRNSLVLADWVHENLNDSGYDAKRPGKSGGYSIECYFSWSTKPITFAIPAPLMASFIAGIW
jgi:hypothetical protein